MSVARQCGILSKDEYVVNVNMTSGERKDDRPEISFDIQSPQFVGLVSSPNQIIQSYVAPRPNSPTIKCSFQFFFHRACKTEAPR